MNHFRDIAIRLIIALVITGCATQAQSPTSPAPIVGPVVPQGQAETRDLLPTIEVVPNCGGGNSTIVKHPSMTIITTHSVEWEVGGEVGVGLNVGGGIIPGGVDLSSSLDTHVSTSGESGIQQSTTWDLPAEPNTVMEYTLMWREIWQSGYIDVRLADQRVIRVNVRYRTGMESSIVGQRQLACDSVQLPPSTPEQAVSTPAVSTSGQDIYNCGFIEELVQKSQVNQILMGSRGAAGVQTRLVEAVDVPIGWTVHIQGVTYEGPVHFDAGTFGSFWGPWQCEPLAINP